MYTIRQYFGFGMNYRPGNVKPMAEHVPVVEKPTTFNMYTDVRPEMQKMMGRKENQNQFSKHAGVMINTGRAQMSR